MDQNENQKLETATSVNTYYKFLKKTSHFLVPVSLLSFLLSYTSGFSFLLSYKFQFSTFVFTLFYHSLERKYMFLICNGILAFLAKNFCFSFPPPPPTVSDPNYSEFAVSELKETPLENMKTSIASPENVALAQEQENRYLNTEEEERGRESRVLITESEDMTEEVDDGVVEGDRSSLIGASSAEEGSEVNLNAEELNKKFEEFIRKMKEEIRIEAQRQLIAV